MRFMKKLFLGVLGLIIGLVAAAYILPREVPVIRSIVIDAPPEEIFPYVNSLQRAAEWSPWLGIDPDVELTYSGPDEGVGNSLSWVSDHPNVGSGQQEITASEPNERVVSSLDFGDMGLATAQFTLERDGDGTKVVWGLLADMGMNPIGRWMGLMMDGWVGPDYEKGLANLKALVEGG